MRIIRAAERVFLVTLFLIMTALFFLNILIREFGGSLASDFSWIEEAVRLMNLFLVFGALGLALERGQHVCIDTLRNVLPASVRAPLLKAIDAAGLVFSVYLVVLSFQLINFVLATGQRSPTLDIPMGWIYVAPFAGFGLLALRYALSLFGFIDRFRRRDDNDDAALVEAAD